MIDVSELMEDPDFATPFGIELVVRKMVVDGHGEGSLQTTSSSITGTVLPATPAQLQRLPEAVRLQKAIQLWTKTRLQAKQPGEGGYSDVIIHRGERFVVQFLEDYSAWGDGFTKAVCSYERPAT